MWPGGRAVQSEVAGSGMIAASHRCMYRKVCSGRVNISDVRQSNFFRRAQPDFGGKDMKASKNRYPPIGDYALIGDCRSTALVSRCGSIDWCCMPDVDSDSCFGRLLDWERGGYCLLAPAVPDFACHRRYLPETMILETTFVHGGNMARLYDFFVMGQGKTGAFSMVRLIEGVQGELSCELQMVPRLDFGDIIPHTRQYGAGVFAAVGSNKGLIVRTDIGAEVVQRRDLRASFSLKAGERRMLTIGFVPPESVDDAVASGALRPMDHDGGLERTKAAWERWTAKLNTSRHEDPQTRRSAIVLKALTYERTGAIVAAPTASLPEWIGGVRNWDYRFSWVRDSVFIVRALYRLGCEREAEQFMRFIQRSSAGSAEQLQIMYGVDGKRRLTEIEFDWLEGYAGSRPVRVGNLASKQNQLDVYGEIMELAWIWHQSRHRIDPPYWDFLVDVVDAACTKWRDRDYGIWEVRGGPRHHVHSKAMCWSAVNYGILLAESCGFQAPIERWRDARAAIRTAIETEGYDGARGIFIQAFGSPYLDSALLLLPRIGFVSGGDPRMVRTTEAIRNGLDDGGLLRRYAVADGLPAGEGVFLPCTFWLVACLAGQGRIALAWDYYHRALACANDLGLFSEEYDTAQLQMLGNFPQGLTHVSQMTARMALDETSTSLGGA
jgi:GH15 family glucan-1,4-alpha-glucosidase